MRRLIRRFRFLLNIRKSIPFLIEFFLLNTIAWKKKALAILFILVYFIFPFDLIPDFLGFFGFFDDLAVLTWILQKIVSLAPQHLKDKYEVKEY